MKKKITSYPKNCEHCGIPIIVFAGLESEQKCTSCGKILAVMSYKEIKSLLAKEEKERSKRKLK